MSSIRVRRVRTAAVSDPPALAWDIRNDNGRILLTDDDAAQLLAVLGGEPTRLRAIVDRVVAVIDRARFAGHVCDVCTETYGVLTASGEGT